MSQTANLPTLLKIPTPHTRYPVQTQVCRLSHGGYSVVYRGTEVVRCFPDLDDDGNPNGNWTFRLNSNGWKTVTTKKRMNDYTPLGLGVWQEKGEWYAYDNRNEKIEYSDNMALTYIPE